MAVSALVGCLSPNPNLASTDSEGDTTSTGGGASGGPTGPGDGSTSGGGPTTAAGATTTGAPSSTTGLASCGQGNVCVSEVPAGWLGPVVRAESPFEDEPPACPDGYPELAFEAYAGFEAAPAECTCECGAASGASCGNVTLEYHGTNADCVGGAFNEFSIGASCQQGPAVTTSNNRYWSVDAPGVSGGSCTPSEGVAVPEASWSGRTVACAAPSAGEAGVCGDSERCVPEPQEGFEPRHCVWQPGAVECPDGPYSDRFLRHTEVSDTRGCEACTCGDPEGECVGTVRLWGTNNCSAGSGQGAVPVGGECVQLANPVSSADLASLSVSSVSCEASPGAAVGEAEVADPYTLCCMTP